MIFLKYIFCFLSSVFCNVFFLSSVFFFQPLESRARRWWGSGCAGCKSASHHARKYVLLHIYTQAPTQRTHTHTTRSAYPLMWAAERASHHARKYVLLHKYTHTHPRSTYTHTTCTQRMCTHVGCWESLVFTLNTRTRRALNAILTHTRTHAHTDCAHLCTHTFSHYMHKHTYAHYHAQSPRTLTRATLLYTTHTRTELVELHLRINYTFSHTRTQIYMYI